MIRPHRAKLDFCPFWGSSRNPHGHKPRITLIACAIALLGACATTSHRTTRMLVEGNDAAIRGDYRAAVDKYESAMQLDPELPAAKRNLGIVLVKVGQYKRAKQMLSESRIQYPADAEVFYFLGEANRGLEEFQPAQAAYQQAIRLDRTDPRSRKALGWTFIKLRRAEKAQEAVESLLRRDPNDMQVRLILANAYNQREQFKKALEVLTPFEKAGFKVQSRDQVSGDSERALLLTALADANLGLMQVARAAQLYQEVLATRPFLPAALIGSARCDLERKNPVAAMDKLERATKADPDSPEAHLLLGELFRQKDQTKAIFYYRRFMLLAKNKPEFAGRLGETRRALAGLERKSAKPNTATRR